MPYQIVSHRDGTYSVKKRDTGEIVAKKTTRQRALAQIRLLQAIEHGFKPTGRK